jgi:hypothetical protein
MQPNFFLFYSQFRFSIIPFPPRCVIAILILMRHWFNASGFTPITKEKSKNQTQTHDRKADHPTDARVTVCRTRRSRGFHFSLSNTLFQSEV